jgi:hypothetical protein
VTPHPPASAAIFFFKSGSTSSDPNPTAVEYILWSMPGW